MATEPRGLLLEWTATLLASGKIRIDERTLFVHEGGGEPSHSREMNLWLVPEPEVLVLRSLAATFHSDAFSAEDAYREAQDGRTKPMIDALAEAGRSVESVKRYLEALEGRPLGGYVLRQITPLMYRVMAAGEG